MKKKIKLKANSKTTKKKKSKTSSGFQKRCRFCSRDSVSDAIDYKNASLLKSFLMDCGKMLPAHVSGNCSPCQRKLSSAIKLSRVMGLIPFCAH
jgi:small subunit ribosomal protein S18